MPKKINMQTIKSIHFIGIGGCGMSALAKILHELDYSVTGSDLKESSNTMRLKDLGIKISIGHDGAYLRQADLVVRSSAIPNTNLEYKEARTQRIPIWQRTQMLAWIMNQFDKRISVAGTHGKTTTTSMLAQIFDKLGYDPTFLIGGETDYVDGNAKLGKGQYAIAESDESDGSLLMLSPNIAIITNIEADHLEFYGNINKIIKTFETFVRQIADDGTLIINVDNQNCIDLINKFPDKNIITYGLTEAAQYYAKNVSFEKNGSKFDIYNKEDHLGTIFLSVPGWQNVQNALAAIAVSISQGLNIEKIAEILSTFSGARRRFQLIGEVNGISIYDDYAHHPTEVLMTLQAAKLGWPNRRLICVFQPHRYTRTLHLKDEFASAFKEADEVILTSIYSAGETPIPGVDSNLIYDKVKALTPQSILIPRKEKIPDYLIDNLKPGDILIVAGAGDIHTIAKETYTRLRVKYLEKPEE